MSSLQKTLDSLQPYVIGIRYLEGTPVVDAVFKEGWTVPEDSNIKKAKGNDELNYYMIFSEVKGIGLDDLLNYVDKTIKVNLEREKKHDLLRTKVNELKEIFKKNSLTKLQRLKFTFAEEELVPNLNDFDIDIDDELEEAAIQPTLKPIYEEEVDEVEDYQTPNEEQPIAAYLDENGNPIEMTEDELELLQEEARAERNRKAIGNKKQNSNINNQSKKVELPPKKKMEMVMSDDDYDTNTDCECEPNEACSKCIDSKGY
jgi:hypothetical protein